MTTRKPIAKKESATAIRKKLSDTFKDIAVEMGSSSGTLNSSPGKATKRFLRVSQVLCFRKIKRI